jgi:hypothetical protein
VRIGAAVDLIGQYGLDRSIPWFRVMRGVRIRPIFLVTETAGIDLGIGSPLGFGPSEHQASHVVWGTVIDAKGALQPLTLE